MTSKAHDADAILDRARPILHQHAQEIVLEEARAMARSAAGHGDDGTNDLIVGGVVRLNEKQAWLVAQHLVDLPLVRAV